MKKLIVVAFLGVAHAAFSADALWDDRPADGNWQNSWYPLGSGALGAMLDGGTDHFRVQFNADTLWTGGKNISSAVTDRDSERSACADKGRYQAFGVLEIYNRSIGAVRDYRRELDLGRAVYSDGFMAAGAGWFTSDARISREAFASRADNLVAIHVKNSRNIPYEVMMVGRHGEKVVCRSVDGKRAAIIFAGVLPNGMGYAARADVVAEDGVVPTEDGEGIRVGTAEFTVYLRAVTSFDPCASDFGLNGRKPELGDEGIPESYELALKRHLSEYLPYWSRVSIDLGGDPAKKNLPTRERVRNCRAGSRDVGLEELLFKFGRYLLIASSRPGTWPANLQGVWNESNRPEWDGDYHTNINLQMNYWGVDVANLSECFDPLADWLTLMRPVTEEGTRAAFPQSRGFAYRTGGNFLGGSSWRWNFAGAPWFGAMLYDHYLFTRDRKFLEETAWPYMKGAAEFLMSTQLKERQDGTVVVKDGWSPEHGPREDGVAHDQQIVRELFRAILVAAKELGVDDDFTREVARLEPKLLKDKIGRWGQLQEWETDRDKKDDTHRHTSHLFAVYPGTTITQSATPDLFAAARVALEGRKLADDAWRSWVWPWRAALWARLGDGEKAGEMVASLLRYNTLDGLFCTHPPVQLDGNFGVAAAIAEMLVQSHEVDSDGRIVVRLLPALPSAWPKGSVKGLRLRGGGTVDIDWRGRKVVDYVIRGGDGYRVVIGETANAMHSDTSDLRGKTRSVAEEGIFVEAESFDDLGGWTLDNQHVLEMGSPYLLAHGIGQPVRDARTTVCVPGLRKVKMWVRTRNWTAPWSVVDAGRFELLVDGRVFVPDPATAEWGWVSCGAVSLSAGKHELRIHDLTGFDGRVDAIYFGDNAPVSRPLSMISRDQQHDLVVVGGGIAGICAALSAARLGLKVALVQDRPVLGGNNSSEVRVHLGGHQQCGRYPHLGDVVAEIGPACGGNAREAAVYEDDKKIRIVRAERNVSLYLNVKVDCVETNGNQIVAVVGVNARTGERMRFSAPLFVDATGDGTVGAMAGACFLVGRESAADYGERSAPDEKDGLCMGASCQWNAVDVGIPCAFPKEPWMIDFRECEATVDMSGDWDWETGLGRDQIAEAERIRDYGMLVAYSNWAFVKNVSKERVAYMTKRLAWVASVAGKRESRRLVGDVVLTENDIVGYRRFPDGTCLTSWSIDLHYPKTSAETGFRGESFRTRCEQRRIVLYPIPFGCLYSRNVSNLMMAGRNISVTHIALGTVRVMRTTGMMGEVVGMAAAVCKERGCLPRDVRQKYFGDLAALMKKGVGAGLPMTRQEYNVHPTLGMDPDDAESIKRHEKEGWNNVDLFR